MTRLLAEARASMSVVVLRRADVDAGRDGCSRPFRGNGQRRSISTHGISAIAEERSGRPESIVRG